MEKEQKEQLDDLLSSAKVVEEIDTDANEVDKALDVEEQRFNEDGTLVTEAGENDAETDEFDTTTETEVDEEADDAAPPQKTTKKPITDPKTAAVKPEDGDKTQEEIASLRETIANLTTQLAERADASATEDEKEATTQQINYKLDELTDEQFLDITTDKKKFTDFINDVLGKSQEKAIREAAQIATVSVGRQATLQSKVTDFYAKNGDLAPHKQYVSFVATKVQGEHSDWTIDQILDETNSRVRKDLAITQKAAEVNNNVKPKVSFPTKPSGATRTAVRNTETKQQKMINDILT